MIIICFSILFVFDCKFWFYVSWFQLYRYVCLIEIYKYKFLHQAKRGSCTLFPLLNNDTCSGIFLRAVFSLDFLFSFFTLIVCSKYFSYLSKWSTMSIRDEIYLYWNIQLRYSYLMLILWSQSLAFGSIIIILCIIV